MWDDIGDWFSGAYDTVGDWFTPDSGGYSPSIALDNLDLGLATGGLDIGTYNGLRANLDDLTSELGSNVSFADYASPSYSLADSYDFGGLGMDYEPSSVSWLSDLQGLASGTPDYSRTDDGGYFYGLDVEPTEMPAWADLARDSAGNIDWSKLWNTGYTAPRMGMYGIDEEGDRVYGSDLAYGLGLAKPAGSGTAATPKSSGQGGQPRQVSDKTLKAIGALQSALRAASMAGTLYQLGTARNGMSADEVRPRDAVVSMGPNFAAAQANRASRGVGYKKGGKVLSDGNHGGLLQIAAKMAEMMHEQMMAGGQDDVVDIQAAPGEYIFDADIVAAIGDGDNDAGARRLDKMRENIRRHKRSAPADKIPPRTKSLDTYMEEV